jgi:glutaminase A
MDLPGLLASVHARLRGESGGSVASYIPELARVPPDLFGLAVCTVDGQQVSAGDDAHRFTLQSLSKPFLYGLVLQERGLAAVLERVGVEPTGDAFDALIQLETDTHRPHNPMVNAGAIAVAGLVPGDSPTARFNRVLELFRAAMGRDDVHADMAVYLSERATGFRNRAIAWLLRNFGVLDEIEATLDLYFQQCSVLADVRDLARMAAMLAGSGQDPLSGARVFPEEVTRPVLAVMGTCGLYDAAGRFAFDVGLPAKSGVCGGILAVVPGRMGLAAFSPRLDGQGNSVRGLRALRELAEALGLHGFEPGPARPPAAAVLRGAAEAAQAAAAQVTGGELATYIPELAGADPERLAVAVCAVDGSEAACGDADQSFTIQAAANPFAYALALDTLGIEAVHGRVGVEPTGNPFHAIVLDPRTRRPFNPLGNAGAIAVAGMAWGDDLEERLQRLLDGLGRFAGEPLHVDRAVFLSEQATGHRNRAIAHLLRHFGVIEDEQAALDLYFQQCSVSVTVRQLARMGAALAADGLQPRTGEPALRPGLARHVLAVMSTCGMHEASGRFAFEVGLPAKSGISGGILAVAPGRFAAAVYAPRVDGSGNSVRGVAALRELAQRIRPST